MSQEPLTCRIFRRADGSLFLTGPKSQNYGAAVEATHAKKAKLQRRSMTREFLKTLGIEDAGIDKILDENMQDIGKEKRKTDAAETALSTAKTELSAAQAELETLKKAGSNTAAVQQQLADLQAKYDTDTNSLRTQLADRDYSDAIARAIARKAIKFSSKSAERAFAAALKEQKLELKDGELSGLDDFIKAQREADPDAFAPDKPAARFVTGSGGGHGEPPESLPENVVQAKEMGAARAAGRKASADIIKNYL